MIAVTKKGHIEIIHDFENLYFVEIFLEIYVWLRVTCAILSGSQRLDIVTLQSTIIMVIDMDCCD